MSPDSSAARYHLTGAPRFALPPTWSARLARNTGVESDDTTGGIYPRDTWVALDERALADAVDPDTARTATLPPTHLGLIQLPDRLRLAWWAQAERTDDPGASDARFEPVFAEITEFLRFKGLPLPEHLHLEVTVSAPGLRSTRIGSDGMPGGLGFGDRPATADSPSRLPRGLVNLGDEATYLTLLPQPPQTMVAQLAARDPAFGGEPPPPPVLAARYLCAFPDEPLLRLRLAPGEGLWLSPFGVLHDGWTRGKDDLDVVLTVG